jgi:hypothetical protein
MGAQVGGQIVVLDALDVRQHRLVARHAALNVAELAERHVTVVGPGAYPLPSPLAINIVEVVLRAARLLPITRPPSPRGTA